MTFVLNNYQFQSQPSSEAIKRVREARKRLEDESFLTLDVLKEKLGSKD